MKQAMLLKVKRGGGVKCSQNKEVKTTYSKKGGRR